MKLIRLLLAASSLAALVRADVTLAPLFQDHAVLQRDKPLPVWGRAAAGEHVTVSFKGQQIGTLQLALGDKPIGEYPLVAIDEVPEAGWFGRLWDALRLWIKNL